MSFFTLDVIKGDARTLRFQLYEDGSVKDITGMSFKFAVKKNLEDASPLIGPISGTIDDATNGKFSFALTSTHTNIDSFSGVYAVAMYDGSGNKTTLTPIGGVTFNLVEDILDVT